MCAILRHAAHAVRRTEAFQRRRQLTSTRYDMDTRRIIRAHICSRIDDEPKPAGRLLLGTPHEVALLIACQVASATDLLHLAMACRRFRVKVLAYHDTRAAGVPEMLSLSDEAARRWVAACSAHELAQAPRRGRESWLGLMHELQLLQAPLAFLPTIEWNGGQGGAGNGRIGLAVEATDDGAVARRVLRTSHYRTVVTGSAMRAGRHSAQFTLLQRDHPVMIGVIAGHKPHGRPGWMPHYDEPENCFLSVRTGHRKTSAQHFCDGDDWQGREDGCILDEDFGPVWGFDSRECYFLDVGDVLGLLLDMDSGSMTVFKNGVRLGVIQPEGLTGVWPHTARRHEGRPWYTWAVVFQGQHDAVRIDRLAKQPKPHRVAVTISCNVTHHEITFADGWFHKRGTVYDLCEEEYHKLSVEENHSFVQIKSSQDLGDDLLVYMDLGRELDGHEMDDRYLSDHLPPADRDEDEEPMASLLDQAPTPEELSAALAWQKEHNATLPWISYSDDDDY